VRLEVASNDARKVVNKIGIVRLIVSDGPSCVISCYTRHAERHKGKEQAVGLP